MKAFEVYAISAIALAGASLIAVKYEGNKALKDIVEGKEMQDCKKAYPITNALTIGAILAIGATMGDIITTMVKNK